MFKCIATKVHTRKAWTSEGLALGKASISKWRVLYPHKRSGLQPHHRLVLFTQQQVKAAGEKKKSAVLYKSTPGEMCQTDIAKGK